MYRKRRSSRELVHVQQHLENGDLELALSLLKRFVEKERERRRVSDEHTDG